jgi:hypothetical protein
VPTPSALSLRRNRENNLDAIGALRRADDEFSYRLSRHGLGMLQHVSGAP